MIVYHGSFVEVPTPDIVHSREKVDFGRGFYVTPIYEQARKWSEKFIRRGKNAIITKYQFDESAYREIKALRFECYSEEWLEFILNCRSGNDDSDFDIIVGGVANDKVFNTVELYFDGLIGKAEAIQQLKYEKPNIQICLRKQEVIDKYLKYEGSERL